MMLKQKQSLPEGTTHIKKRPPLSDGAIRVSGDVAMFYLHNDWRVCANLTAQDVVSEPQVFVPVDGRGA